MKLLKINRFCLAVILLWPSISIANTDKSPVEISIISTENAENPERVIDQLIQQEREFLQRESAGLTGDGWSLQEKSFAKALYLIIIQKSPLNTNTKTATKLFITTLQQLQQKYPDSGLVNVKLAETLATNRQFTEADKVYRQAIAKRPGYLEVIKKFALFRQSRQEFKQAEALLESGVAAHPQNLWAYTNAATVSRQQNYKFQLFERAVAVMPEQESTYEEFSKLFTNKLFDFVVMNRTPNISYPKSSQVFKKYNKSILDSEKLDIELNFAAQPKNLNRAISLLQLGNKKFPKNARLYAALGWAKGFQASPGKISSPIIRQSLEQGLANGADPKTIYAWLGDLDSVSQPIQAIDFYQKAVDAGGDFCGVQYRSFLAFNIVSKGLTKPIEARSTTKLANLSGLLPLIEKSLKSQQSYESQSTCFSSLMLIEQVNPELKSKILQTGKAAIANFDRTLREPDPANYFGSIYTSPSYLLKWMIEEKQYAEAIQLGDQLFTKFPRAWDLMFLVGQAHQETKQWAKAIDAYQRSEAVFVKELSWFAKKYPRSDISAMHRWQLGLVAEAQGDIDGAINHFQLATQGIGNNSSFLSIVFDDNSEDQKWNFKLLAHNRLGEIFLKRGQKAEAIQQFRAALKEGSRYQRAIDNLKKAQQL
jgi:tetratricopeptide (TPR) repeat protein